MTKNQRWATIILSFILLFTITIGGYTYGILNSPAATSKIDIDADMMLEMSKDGELQLKYIHLNKIEGEFNSKILDLILLAVQ